MNFIFPKRVLFLLIIFVSIFAHGQGYYPEIGENVLFYPVSDELRNSLEGFDCFYAPRLALKHGKYSFTAKNRYNTTASGLTPYEEIEGKIFNVENIEKVTFKKREYYVLNLRREDNQSIILAIPFFANPDENQLTHSMMIKSKTTGYYSNNTKAYASIPCINMNLYNKAKQIIGKLYGSDNDMFIETGYSDGKDTRGMPLYQYLKDRTQSIKGNEQVRILKYQFFKVNKIEWLTYPGFAFQKLSAYCNFDDGTSGYMPIVDHILKGGTYYFENYYTEKEVLLKRLVDNEKVTWLDELVGKKLYYGLYDKQPKNDFFYSADLVPINPEKGFYNFKGYDVFYLDLKPQILIKLEDSKGEVILSQTKEKKTTNIYSSYNEKLLNFNDFFTTEEEAKSYWAAQELEKQREEEQYIQWKKKYGLKIADYLREHPYDVDNFIKYSKKYGNSTALDICQGYVKIGWDKEKCRLSWGEPRDINKSIGSWGVHEQWCYSGSYLYFENGRLTSIQN